VLEQRAGERGPGEVPSPHCLQALQQLRW
jgi:hypothetical protein